MATLNRYNYTAGQNKINDLITSLQHEINNYTNYAVDIKNNDSVVDIEKFKTRGALKNTLSDILSKVESIHTHVSQSLTAVKLTHTRELNAVRQLMNLASVDSPPHNDIISPPPGLAPPLVPPSEEIQKYKPNESCEPLKQSAWNIVARNKPSGNVAAVATTSQITPPEMKTVFITSALFVRAVRMVNWDELRAIKMTDGVLYYVESANHFAITLAGCFLHGNIGTIFTDHRDPVKIKDCRYGANCTRDNCEYYHDSYTGKSTTDIRNYVSSSFIYTPITTPDAIKNKRLTRRFGSLPNLDTDINNISEEEARRYMDQTMHSLLCSIILNNYKLGKSK